MMIKLETKQSSMSQVLNFISKCGSHSIHRLQSHSIVHFQILKQPMPYLGVLKIFHDTSRNIEDLVISSNFGDSRFSEREKEGFRSYFARLLLSHELRFNQLGQGNGRGYGDGSPLGVCTGTIASDGC